MYKVFKFGCSGRIQSKTIFAIKTHLIELNRNLGKLCYKPIPENPFPHAGMLIHKLHHVLFLISYSMGEESLLGEINGVPHFCLACIHKSEAVGFLFHHLRHSIPLVSQDWDAQQFPEHSLLSPIPYAPEPKVK